MAVELKAVAKLDGKPFDRNVKKMGQSVDKFKTNQLSGLKGAIAGAFSVGVLIQFGRRLLKTADDMQTAANIFGTSMEKMIAFKAVMAESGIGAERFNKIFGRIASAQVDVRNGLATYIDALKEMNISASEFKNLEIDQVLGMMAKKYQEAGNQQRFVGGMTKLLGARTVDLIEVFQRMNKEGMAGFNKEAEKVADGMRVFAQISDSMEGAMNGVIDKTATMIGLFAKLKFTIADAINEHKSLRQAWQDLGDTPIVSLSKGAAKRAKDLREGMLLPSGRVPIDEEALEREWALQKAINELKEKEQAKIKENEKTKKKEKKDKPVDALKEMNDATRLDERRMAKQEDFNRAQDEIAIDFAERRADIMAGKGIETPGMARVDPLQAIGGLIGGVAGKGDQAARIAERQTKTQEAIAELVRDTNRKFDALNLKLDGIID